MNKKKNMNKRLIQWDFLLKEWKMIIIMLESNLNSIKNIMNLIFKIQKKNLRIYYKKSKI